MIISPIQTSLLLALVLLLTTGCASREDVSTLQGQVSHQQQQQALENQELKKHIVSLESELSKAREDLQQEISKTNQPVRSKQADLWVEIEQLRVQLATAKGEIDGLNKKLQGLQATQDNATVTLSDVTSAQARTDRAVTAIAGQLGMDLQEFEDAPPPPVQPLVQTSDPKAKAPQPKPTQTNSAQALYKKALNSFYAKKYSLAISLWEEFSTTFKKNKLVPNALFWQGECHYQMRDYARAILSYQKVIEKYKKSTKYRPALLKQGMSFFLLNKKKPGRLVLQDLIKKYPKSAEARRAKAFLRTRN